MNSGKYPVARSAAFFDVDGTLVRGDTQEMEARALVRKKREPGYLAWLALTLGAARLNRMGLISVTRQNLIYLRSYRGMEKDELSRQAAQLFQDKICTRFFPSMLNVLDRHRAEGCIIVLISATTRHLMTPIQKMLNPDAVFCTDLEFDRSSKSTGRPRDCICAEEKKPELIRQFALAQGINLAHSFAYADHHSDIALLSAVGHPCAVNPTPKLAAQAKQAGWRQIKARL